MRSQPQAGTLWWKIPGQGVMSYKGNWEESGSRSSQSSCSISPGRHHHYSQLFTPSRDALSLLLEILHLSCNNWTIAWRPRSYTSLSRVDFSAETRPARLACTTLRPHLASSSAHRSRFSFVLSIIKFHSLSDLPFLIFKAGCQVPVVQILLVL